MRRIMALDIGEKRIGVAFNQGSAIAFPGGTISGDADPLTSILKLVETWRVEEIVLGLPLRTDHSEGQAVQKVKSFARNLAEQFSGTIVFWDERFSSREAERRLIEGNMSRKKRKKTIDQFSAMLILQAYLNRENQ